MSTRSLIPIEQLPGFARWGASLDALVASEVPVLVMGEPGCGVSSMGAWLAQARGVAFLDDPEPAVLANWLKVNPRGIVGSHGLAMAEPEVLGRFLVLSLPSLAEEPESVAGCLSTMAASEGMEGSLPPALGGLPCPGNLLGLRNRLLRWKLLGQLPEPAAPSALVPLEAEDLATNLHALERVLLFRALRRSYGNRVEAAKRLGVSRRQLYLLVERHGDPVRGEPPIAEGPKRLKKQQNRQNSSASQDHR